ncbi:hypothetical protein OSTOST_12666, partial [Ostertagia ostertagi]
MENANISAQMYNDLDTDIKICIDDARSTQLYPTRSCQPRGSMCMAIDYSCIFTLGCPKECTACSLCHTSKLQVIEVLAGKVRK